MSAPRVTVLTAVRNGGRYLAETIASVRAQTFTDWEYIIVDDASDDDTHAVIQANMRVDSRLRVLRRERSGGPYAAANEGVRSARGEYIVRIDGDDLSPPHRIERQLSYLASHPHYRACVSFLRFFDERGLRAGISTVPMSPRVLRWYLLLRGISTHSSLCIERGALLELGGYRELMLSQDYRLLCELTRLAWLGVVPEALSFVRVHERRVSIVKSELQRTQAMEVAADHLFALSGERWPQGDVEALRAVGHSMPLSIREGFEILDRWDDLWQAATDLEQHERRELARLSRFRRWKHFRANAPRQPLAALAAATRLGVWTRLAEFVQVVHGAGRPRGIKQ